LPDINGLIFKRSFTGAGVRLNDGSRGGRAGRKARRDEYVSCWSEPELLNAERVECLVVILRTRGCGWAVNDGCTMCGYKNDTLAGVGGEDILKQWAKASGRRKEERMLKVFTSGSFLDPDEVPPDVQRAIVGDASAWAERVIIESRPEYTSAEWLAEMAGVTKLQVAIGLETASDLIRQRCVNKGFTWEDYKSAAERVKEAGASVKTYLLLKPPFLTEKEAIEDAVASIGAAGELSETISLNPVNVQRGTLAERLWRAGEYRPPWLWSVMEVLERGSRLTDARLVCDPTGGGKGRGAHNCGKCDKLVLDALKAFSISGDASALGGPDCGCRGEWNGMLRHERYLGTPGAYM